MASTARKVDHAGVMFRCCRNHVNCEHGNITMHAFIHQTCMASSWQNTKKVISSGCTPSSRSEELPYHARAWRILQVWHSKRPHHMMASCWTLSKHPPGFHILHTCGPSYSPCKDISSHPLLMICSWTHLPSSSAITLAYAFSTPTKVTEFPSCCIFWNTYSAFCPCPHFTSPNIMAVQLTTFFRLHLVKHSSSILNDPTFCIHLNQAIPHKDIRLTTTLNDLFISLSTIFKCS